MSLKSGNYRKNLENISIDIVSVKSKAEDAVLEFVDLSAQFQDLSAQVQSLGVGEVITADNLNRNFDALNLEYVVSANKQDWSLTLTAGTYMFVFTPYAFVTNADGSNPEPIWTSTNCNCEYLEYKLGDYALRMSIYPDLSVPVGNYGKHIKFLGKQTMIFTLATETTLGLTAMMSSPENGTIVIDPLLLVYSSSTIEYVKLA